jgi:hypothetical protein
MFQSPDRAGIPVHIAIVTVTGRVNQNMQDEKDQDSPRPVPVNNLAEGEPIDWHEKEREMQPQQLESGPL